MLAWQETPVSDSMDRESDESEFEEDQELAGEQEESDDEQPDDDDYAEYGEVGGDEDRRPSHPRRAEPVLGRHPSVVYIATLQTGPVAQLVRAHA